MAGPSHEQGKVDEAMAEFRAATRINPDHAIGHANLGLALKLQGKLEEAIAEFRAAIRINPHDADAHFHLGDALNGQGKLEEAIAEFRAAIRFDPRDAEAHNQLKIALEKWGERNEAIAEYRPAIKTRSPASAFAAIGATLLRCLGFGKRRGQQPADADAHYNRGITLAEQGKLDEAVAEFRSAIRLQPELVGAHIGLANALGEMACGWRAGPLARPRSPSFGRRSDSSPTNADAHYGLADTLGRQGQRGGGDRRVPDRDPPSAPAPSVRQRARRNADRPAGVGRGRRRRSGPLPPRRCPQGAARPTQRS